MQKTLMTELTTIIGVTTPTQQIKIIGMIRIGMMSRKESNAIVTKGIKVGLAPPITNANMLLRSST